MKKLVFALVLLGGCMSASKKLSQIFSVKSPFHYDLGIKVIQSNKADAGIMLCLHGMGADNRIIDVPRSSGKVHDTLISFNFPDHTATMRNYDPRQTSYGSINELLPPLYIIKKCVVEAGYDAINLYGFSAGGAAIINLISVLVQTRFDDDLARIGITSHDKKNMLAAIERGRIILDCPMKSVDEIIDVRGTSYELEIFAKRYRENNLRPIDLVENLKGFKFSILVHFQVPDEIIGNRDDDLFIKRLQQFNSGTTKVVIGHDGGHNSWHESLWKNY